MKRIRLSLSSVRVRLLLLVLLTVVPALGLTLYTAHERRQLGVREARESLLQLGRNASDDYRLLMENTRQLLGVLARLPAVVQQEPAGCHAIMADLIRTHPHYLALGVLKPNGDLFCRHPLPAEPVNVADFPWFQRALQSRDFTVGNYQIGRVSKQPVLPFAYPVLDKAGKVQALVYAIVSINWLKHMGPRARLPRGFTFTLFDINSVILVEQPGGDESVGKPAEDPVLIQALKERSERVVAGSGADGVPRFIGLTPLGGDAEGEIILAISVPQKTVFSDADRILNRNLFLLGIVSLLALGAAWFGCDLFVLRQLNSLLSASKRLGSGDLSVRTGLTYTGGELSQIACAFDEMADALQKRRAEAERIEREREGQVAAVERKTKELSALHAVASAVSRSLDLDIVLTEALEKLLEVLGFKAGRIFIVDERKRELRLKACQGITGPLAQVEPYRIGEGIVGKVAETGETMIFDDIQTSPEFRRLARRGAALDSGFRGLACFPIKVREKILGLVNLFDDRLHRFTSDEITLIASMANQIGVAIENAKLFDEVERKVAELEAVVAINRDVVSVLDRDILLPRISDQARRIFKVDRASFRLVDKHWSVRVGWVGEREPSGGSQRLPLRETVTDKLIREDRPIIIKNVREEPVIVPAHREMMIKDGYCSFLAVPLRLRGRIVGSLNLYSTVEREFTPEEVNGIGAFADQAALAIQNADLFGELRKKAAELEKANRVKDEFLSVMSHELRTPLNVVMGYTGMILDRMLGEINQPQEKALEKVLRQSNDLLGLINSIMVVTKIAADEVKVENHEVHLGEVFEEIRSLYETPMDKELTLIWDYPPKLPLIITDREKIGHILQNLIHNAVKFTEKGTVTISARLRQQAISNRHESSILTPSASCLTPPYVEFKVADTGIGIKKEAFPTIFEMFRLGDSSETRPYGGVGLGLYIVRKFTEMLGGTVEVESEPGKGSTFTVTVPCQSNGAGVMRT